MTISLSAACGCSLRAMAVPWNEVAAVGVNKMKHAVLGAIFDMNKISENCVFFFLVHFPGIRLIRAGRHWQLVRAVRTQVQVNVKALTITNKTRRNTSLVRNEELRILFIVCVCLCIHLLVSLLWTHFRNIKFFRLKHGHGHCVQFHCCWWCRWCWRWRWCSSLPFDMVRNLMRSVDRQICVEYSVEFTFVFISHDANLPLLWWDGLHPFPSQILITYIWSSTNVCVVATNPIMDAMMRPKTSLAYFSLSENVNLMRCHMSHRPVDWPPGDSKPKKIKSMKLTTDCRVEIC